MQPLKLEQITPGFDRHAYWLMLDLFNSGTDEIERWVSTGHPRLAEVSLFSKSSTGWLSRDVGNLTPLDQRDELERQFAVFPVRLHPGEHKQFWIRIHSDTAINLLTRIWTPTEFLDDYQQRLFWSVLAGGGVLIAILLSLLMFALTRQPPYFFFSIGLSGVLINVSLSLGVLQRFIWPEHWPLPSQVIAVSVLVSLLGFYKFTQTFLPSSNKRSLLDRLFKLSVLLSLAVLIYGISIDYFAATRVWGYCVALAVLFAFIKTYRAWQSGYNGAKFLAFSFCIYLCMTLLRLLAIRQGSWYSSAAILSSWGIVLTTPVILVGLLDRTRQLSAELNRAQCDNLKQLNFMAGMSHELRTPLDTILGNVQLLTRRQQSAETREGLSIIFQTGRHLLHLIQHILDFSRGQAGVVRIIPRPVDLFALLSGVERNARLLARTNNNRFELVIAGAVSEKNHAEILLLDSDALRQVLDNLITNAARHTDQGLITLTVNATPRHFGQMRIEFEVSDTGEGIAPNNLERIFMPFERGFSNRHNDKGAGLGLAISRQLVELMGGELTASSKPGHGSRFRFSIPARAADSSVAPCNAENEVFGAHGYIGSRKSILLVDDVPESRAVLACLLSDLGFLVTEAESGDSAIQIARGMTNLDLVITDQFMSGGDGWTVLNGLADVCPEVPVFLVSGGPPNPPPNQDDNHQFAAHFLRPLDHDRLLLRIGDTLGLTWIHDADLALDQSPSTTGDLPYLSVSSFLIPEESALRELAVLVDTGQISAIKDWATALAQSHPIHQGFAEAVLSSAARLDMDSLRALCRGDVEALRHAFPSNCPTRPPSFS